MASCETPLSGDESDSDALSAKPKPDYDFDPRQFYSLMSQMEARLNENSKILSSLVEKDLGPLAHTEDATPPHKRLKIGPDYSSFVASRKAYISAAENANCHAAEAATLSAAETAIPCHTAETVDSGLDGLVDDNARSNVRAAEENVVSLFGGPEFES